MADRRSAARWTAAPVAALFLALLVLIALLAGCGSPSRDDPDRAVQRMLDRRAAALLERDADGFVAAADPSATAFRAQQRRVFHNLADVPLKGWEYRLTRTGGFEPAAGGEGRRIAAEVLLRYRIEGQGAAPVTALQRLTVTERDGRWYVAAEESRSPDRRHRARQLWDQGEVVVARGSHSLVLGVGQEPRRLRAIARDTDLAVPAVNDAWRGTWARRVLVLVPESVSAMGELLGASEDAYQGLAAVTTGEAGAPRDTAADRVIINPDAYGVLGEFGRSVVLTHEVTHVATRAHTSAATPMWLSEGFADWAGYRATGRTPRELAPELTRAAAAARLPRHLPRNEDFGSGGDGGRPGVAYEGSWLACRMIAERWGEDRLGELYRRVGADQRPEGAADRGLRAVLGVGLDDFTAQWRAYLARELLPGGAGTPGS
ncbi:hypothetical protein [Streptomyces sp. KR80]|uniref:hypothetical protein n=1 Tax=Streptomyces sp. KR80 TaxID=3457426 RepID=UPI003FD4C507